VTGESEEVKETVSTELTADHVGSYTCCSAAAIDDSGDNDALASLFLSPSS